MAERAILLRKDADQLRIKTYGNNVADGVTENPTDFSSPSPEPSEVKAAILAYTNSIKPIREKSIITDETTEELRVEAINIVNALIRFAFNKVNGDDAKLRNANIELPKAPTKHQLKKLEVKTSRMGNKKGSYYFRFVDRGGAGLIGIFRKNAIGGFDMIDAFDASYFTLENQPSGEQTYMFRGKKGKDWGPKSNEVTVNIP